MACEWGTRKGRTARLVLICVALTFASERAFPSDDGAPPAPVKTHGRGTLRVMEGVPFLTLSGSYREMGEQYGALMKERIARYLPHEAGALAREERRGLERRLGSRFAELLRGVAKGTGTSYDALLGGYFGLPAEGCSSVLAKVRGGDAGSTLLHAKNMDLPGAPPLEAHAVVEFRPRGELRFLTTTILGFADGMNERGITLSLDAGSRCPHPPESLPPREGARDMAGAFMDVLATARTLRDADRALTEVVPGGALLVIVGSAAEADGAVFDLACGTMRRTAMGAATHLVATNTFLHPDVTPPGALLECPRYRLLAARLERDPVAGADDLVTVLSDPGSSYGVNNVHTRHSAIYDGRAGVLRLAMQDGYAAWGKWVEYDWRRDRVIVRRDALYRLGELTVAHRPAQAVAALRATVPTFAEQAGLWAELRAEVAAAGLAPLGPGSTVYHQVQDHGVDLEVVQPVTELADARGRVRFEVTPPAEVISVVHHGPHATLPAAHRSLAAWMAAHGRERAGASRETWIRGSWNEPDESRWETIVEVPVAAPPAPGTGSDPARDGMSR